MTRVIGIGAPGSQPAATFDEPFEMLEACHERLDRTLALLSRLREHVAANGADEQARQAARDVMRYFDQAAPEHHRDEELHVFPPLLAQGDPQVVGVVRRLQEDHLAMERGWVEAREVLQALAGGELQALDGAQEAKLSHFAQLYASHIEAEEQIAYPQARRQLDEGALERMSQDMRERRNRR